MAAAVIVSAADLSECVELHALRNLYLKPISKLVIVVTMPAFKVPGIYFKLILTPLGGSLGVILFRCLKKGILSHRKLIFDMLFPLKIYAKKSFTVW